MDSPALPTAFVPSAEDDAALREMLGYLNFSNGQPDAKFQGRLNRFGVLLHQEAAGAALRDLLLNRLRLLATEGGAFADVTQARGVIEAVFDQVIPAYRTFHADLLAHIDTSYFYDPFFVARVFEATLAQGGPWNDTQRLVDGALNQLNDYLGHRPVAVLENRRRMQPYSHERHRPIPLYIRQVGVAHGRYQPVVSRALEILRSMPPAVLAGAYFDLNLLDELALDLRAYDNSHPVYRRTNYTFGEWDPHLIDVSGRYRRFVVRCVILDALLNWMHSSPDIPEDEQLSEAAAVLSGTMLMASSISGAGPDTHDSSISLTNLLPRVARQRDAFYQMLLQSMTGKHAERLRREAQLVQQPFGKIRQHLNLYLANYGCQQLQRSQLAWLYARMGYGAAARRQARIIPAASTRFDTEIQLQLTQAILCVDQQQTKEASDCLDAAVDLLHRGIECGALADPWNILGFQGHFPLFASREDAVPDPRIDRLLAMMDQIFNAYSRVECEAAAAGQAELVADLHRRFHTLATWWDQFASTAVADLQPVLGEISCDSARRVGEVLLAWRAAGEGAGDLAFWKKHVETLDSARACATVIELLLRKRDTVASMNLLIQWLSQGETVPLEAGVYAYWPLLQNWVRMTTTEPQGGPATDPKNWDRLRTFFERVEVNGGEWTQPPRILGEGKVNLKLAGGLPPEERRTIQEPAEPFDPFELPEESEEEENPLFGAAYENVVFRDSANDGHQGDTLDESISHIDTDLDQLAGPLEQRLRFLVSLSNGWRLAAEWGLKNHPEQLAERRAVVQVWSERNEELIRGLVALVERLNEWQPQVPGGDPDSLAEFDRELHLKFSVLNNSIGVVVGLQENGRILRTLLRDAPPASDVPAAGTGLEERVQRLMQALESKSPEAVQAQLMPLLKQLSRLPLLYVPLDRGGKVREILAARNLQGLLRLLLRRLPQLGLFREGWQVLRTAYNMERANPPQGMSITEFDRLLETSVHASLEVVLDASRAWRRPDNTDKKTLELFHGITELSMRLWLKHSSTMRLSTIEAMNDRHLWREIKTFIKNYGADLFHPRMLSIGNLRGIVQRGAAAYLDYLEENADPLHPIRLLNDIDYVMSRESAADTLEIILRSVVEKFDRFLEYNSTTTHSDYGEQLHCLLDFERLEADYDRQDWNLAPIQIAHDVLSRAGRASLATEWQKYLGRKTGPMARSFLTKLKRLEKTHGMRLPSVTDRLNERFIKPLVLDSILALVRPAMIEVREGAKQESFPRLEILAEEYLSTSSGSPTDIQPWMQELGEEVQVVEGELHAPVPFESNPTALAQIPISFASIREQIDQWEHT